MGFWESAFKVGKVIMNSLNEEAQRAQGRASQQRGNYLAEQERKLKQYESRKHELSPEQREKFEQSKITYEKQKAVLQSKGLSVNAQGEMKYGHYTFKEWDSKWQSIGPLASANLTPYNKSVGIYRHRFQGQVVYIGRAIELHNGGFRKRLSDYRRDSDSARKHTSGRLINEHLDQITTDLLVVGQSPEDIQITKELEVVFVGKYRPKWNTMLK